MTKVLRGAQHSDGSVKRSAYRWREGRWGERAMESCPLWRRHCSWSMREQITNELKRYTVVNRDVIGIAVPARLVHAGATYEIQRTEMTGNGC